MKFAKLLYLAPFLLGVSLSAQAQTKELVADLTATPSFPYWINADRTLWRSGTGLCWRSGSWSLEDARRARFVGDPLPAGCVCDKDLMPAGTCDAPKPAAAPAPAPAAAPAPAPAPVAAPRPAPAPTPAPAPAPRPVVTKVSIPADAAFAFGKADLSAEGQSRLDAYVAQLKGLDIESVNVTGHADRIGADKPNQALSEKRAQTVKSFLVSRGIAENRIFAEGKGETQPVTGEQCRRMGPENGRNKKLVDCLAPDRRIDIQTAASKTEMK